MKSQWNPGQYLLFEQERNQPAVDLIERVSRLGSPLTIADLGCGPGNSTALLKKAFSQAEITGFDSSSDMIEKARFLHPSLHFVCRDIRELEGRFDLLFSNACLQWVEDHERFFLQPLKHLNPGGILAVQMPVNQMEPLYQIAEEVIRKWNFNLKETDQIRVLAVQQYFDLLTLSCRKLFIWECRYYHSLKDQQALIEWIKGTRLRPYLSLLDESGQEKFLEQIYKELEKAYPLRSDGTVLLGFNRFFLIAQI